MPLTAMRQLEERHVATKIELMVWSHKMDLLAFSNAKGEVALHRLNWQRVWLLPPPIENGKVDALMWRPDGKVIAIAYSTLRVLLINVENKETLHTLTIPCRVTVMAWPQEKDKEATNNLSNKNIANVYLPKLPTLCRHFRTETESNDENLEDIKKVKSQTVLNFLIVCLEDGKVLISVFGLNSIGQIETNIHLPRGHHCSKILGCELSKDLLYLYIVALVTSKASQNIKVLTLDTKILHERSKELHTLSIKYGHILSLLDYLSNTMSNIKETWENILLKEMQLKLINYAKHLPKGQLSSDLIELLVNGTPTEHLERFLTRELCDKNIKKLGNVIELNCLNMQRLILKHLYSFGQNLAYHIQELKGMSKLGTFASLGLKEDIVGQGFTAIGTFLVKATEVQYVIDDFLKKHKAFFKWLHNVIVKISDNNIDNNPVMFELNTQELHFIADYLCTFDALDGVDEEDTSESDKQQNENNQSKILFDTLGQYFTDKELVKTYKTEIINTNPWEELLINNPLLAKHNIIIPRHNNLSLIQEINILKVNIENIFKNTETSINNSIQLKGINQIKTIKQEIKSVSCTYLLDEKKFLLTYIDPDMKSFQYIEIEEDNINKINYKTLYLNLNNTPNNNLNILDVKFYTNEIISVLTENDNDINGFFIQIPIIGIRQYDDNCITSTSNDTINIKNLIEPKYYFNLVGIVPYKFASSGTRNVLIILSENKRKIRLFEIDNDDDDDEEEGEEEEDENMSDSSVFKNTSK